MWFCLFSLRPRPQNLRLKQPHSSENDPKKITLLKREKHSPGQILWNLGLKTCLGRQNQKLKKTMCPQNFNPTHGFLDNRMENTTKKLTVVPKKYWEQLGYRHKNGLWPPPSSLSGASRAKQGMGRQWQDWNWPWVLACQMAMKFCHALGNVVFYLFLWPI